VQNIFRNSNRESEGGVMSRERELLSKASLYLEAYWNDEGADPEATVYRLFMEIDRFLGEPAQEPEPVALVKHDDAYDSLLATLRAVNKNLHKEIAQLCREIGDANEEIEKLKAELLAEQYASADLTCENTELKAKLAMLYERLSDDVIRKTYLETGFKIQEGLTDLKPYVYKSAHAIHQAILARIEEEEE
jgi:regulator of replication initiation timing